MIHRYDMPNMVVHLQAIDVIRRYAAPACREELLMFYGDLLGLNAVDTLDDSAEFETLRFRTDRTELRYSLAELSHDPYPPVRLVVDSLEAAVHRLEEHHIRYQWWHGFRMTDQTICINDPARNPVTLTQTWRF